MTTSARIKQVCAMARRSAISGAAGKEFPEEPSPDRLHELADEIGEDGLHDTSNFLHAYARNVLILRTHATALQSKLAESSLAADDANLSAIAAKEETELLRKRLSEVEEHNARLKLEVEREKTLLPADRESVGQRKRLWERAESAETRLREVTAERDALVSCADYNAPEQPCKGCSKPLLIENAWMEDGCPCNTPAGVNNANLFRWNLLHKLQQKQSRDLTAANLRAETAQSDTDVGKAIQRACGELPEGFDIHIELENGAGTVRLYKPDETMRCDFDDADSFAGQINMAIDDALKEPANGNG